VDYSHFVWAIISTKEHVRTFVQREGQSENAMELHGELELLYLLGRFFDRVLYYAAVGYEQESIPFLVEIPERPRCSPHAM